MLTILLMMLGNCRNQIYCYKTTQTLGLTFQSDNNVALANAICHKLFGGSKLDYVVLNEVKTKAKGEWKSRENLHDSTVIYQTESVNEEQAKRDHEHLMLQLQMQLQTQQQQT